MQSELESRFWRKLKLWRIARILSFCAFIPSMILAAAIGASDDSYMFFAIPSFVGFTLCSFRLMLIRCPKCGRHFISRLFWDPAVFRSCIHCGYSGYDEPTYILE